MGKESRELQCDDLFCLRVDIIQSRRVLGVVYMNHKPERYHRRSIRLKGYDYAQAGAYFVSLVSQCRDCLFGEVVDGKARLNDAGRMVQLIWDEIPANYPGVKIDAFIIMPNHIHGIIKLAGPDPCASPVSMVFGRQQREGQPRGVAPTIPPQNCNPNKNSAYVTGLSLSDVVHRFKTMTTRQYAYGVKEKSWPPFRERLWQRNYHEHIIRSEAALERIRQYIQDNPTQWLFDRENPSALAVEPEEAWRI
jgi:putative transposase